MSFQYGLRIMTVSLVMNLSKDTMFLLYLYHTESEIVLPKEMSCTQSCPAVTCFRSICCEERCKLLCLAYLALVFRLIKSSNSELYHCCGEGTQKHPAKLGTDFGLLLKDGRTEHCYYCGYSLSCKEVSFLEIQRSLQIQCLLMFPIAFRFRVLGG